VRRRATSSRRAGEDAVEIVLVGFGKMGQLVGSLAPHPDATWPASSIRTAARRQRGRSSGTASTSSLGFSTPDVVAGNAIAREARHQPRDWHDGWQKHEAAVREAVAPAAPAQSSRRIFNGRRPVRGPGCAGSHAVAAAGFWRYCTGCITRPRGMRRRGPPIC
jgi:hypothetical protein